MAAVSAVSGLLYGAHKYDQYRIKANIAKEKSARLLLLKNNLSEETRSLIRKCLNLNPMIITQVNGTRSEIPKFSDTALCYQKFDDLFDIYFQHIHEDSHFNNLSHWVDENKCDLSFLSQSNLAVFTPYIQKVVANPDSLIVMHGDLHGDVHSLIAFLDDLKEKGILNEDYKIITDAYIAFLGDFTDRGLYGAEAIALIMYLKCINGDKFLLARGNHEDQAVNMKERINSFVEELMVKFKEKVSSPTTFFSKIRSLFGSSEPEKFQYKHIFEKVEKFYETLPLGIFLGTYDKKSDITNYYLLCHGGVEVGLDPHPLWKVNSPIAYQKIERLDRESQLDKMCKDAGIATIFDGFYKDIIKVGIETIKKELGEIYSQEIKIENQQQLIYHLLCNHHCGPHTWINYKPTGIMIPHTDDDLRDQYKLICGLQWNDYRVETDEDAYKAFEKNPGKKRCVFPFVKEAQGRGWTIGELFNKAVLALYSDEKNIVRGVMRAHQHVDDLNNTMMRSIFKKDGCDHQENKGVSKLWRPAPVITVEDDSSDKGKEKMEDAQCLTSHHTTDAPQKMGENIVCTFNVAPYTPYQALSKEFNFDTYGILRMAPSYDDWKLEVHRITAQKLLGERFTYSE